MNRIRSIFLAAALASSCGCAGFRTCTDPWWGRDKAQHLALSMVIGAGSAALAAGQLDSGEAFVTGWSAAAAAGAGKEWHDLTRKNTCWSWRDFFWDCVGASIGASLAWTMD